MAAVPKLESGVECVSRAIRVMRTVRNMFENLEVQILDRWDTSFGKMELFALDVI